MKIAKVLSDDLNRVISATKKFVGGSNYTNYRYIKLEFDANDEKMTAVATDGYRLSVESAKADCRESFEAYIDGNIKLPKNNNAIISLEGKEVIIRCGGLIFGLSQPERSPLDWRKVIPTTDAAYKVGFNGNYLLEVLQSVKASCQKDYKKAVVLELRSPNDPIVLRTNGGGVRLLCPIKLGPN